MRGRAVTSVFIPVAVWFGLLAIITWPTVVMAETSTKRHTVSTEVPTDDFFHNNYNTHESRNDVTSNFSQNFHHQSPTALKTLQNLRGGNGPFGFRTPARVVPPPGQKSSSGRFQQLQQQGQEQQQQQQQQQHQQNGDTDNQQDQAKATKEMIDAFLTRDSRNTFIARVYAVLGGQLLVTALSCVLFGLFPPVSLADLASSGTATKRGIAAMIPLFSILVSTVAWFRVSSSTDARRKSPNKWWWLSLYTIGEAISVGFLSSFYKFESVVSAMITTAIATFTISTYTISQKDSKYDLSQWGNTLASWAMILLVYILIGIIQEAGLLPANFFPYSDMAYSFFGACIFSAFLAFHTRLIVGGKHSKYRMNEKDYVYGAMALYTDIINIFLNILQLLGGERE